MHRLQHPRCVDNRQGGHQYSTIPQSYAQWATLEFEANGDMMHPEFARYVRWAAANAQEDQIVRTEMGRFSKKCHYSLGATFREGYPLITLQH
eukprot:4888776-Amphidinium_carterae.1